jgi:hypothetical protein
MPSQLLDRPGEELESDEVAVQMTIHEKAVRIQHGNCGTQESNAINTIGACMISGTIPDIIESPVEAIATTSSQRSTRQGFSAHVNTRYLLSLADIVVQTLQSENEVLPLPGDWVFFPLPLFRSVKVDMGTQPKGWKLQLVALSSNQESILLSVPPLCVVNGCQKEG